MRTKRISAAIVAAKRKRAQQVKNNGKTKLLYKACYAAFKLTKYTQHKQKTTLFSLLCYMRCQKNKI
jgi:hypothetical protein